MANFASLISFSLLFVLFATTFNRSILCNTEKEVRCNENDQQILLIFKQGVVDSSNQLSSWISQDDCCLWEGVQCDNITGRVIELDLEGHGLQGVINLSLLQLEFLNSLDLSYNYLTSVCIPPCQDSKFAPYRDKSNNHSFATSYTPSPNFSAPLHYLDFSGNDMALNDLHWLSRLPSLKYLNLSGNDIGGEPKWLHYVAMLPSLSQLRLRDCSLIDFPSYNYVNFTSLETLDLSVNKITSEFPNSFFNVTKDISFIDLGYNNFHGGLPLSLFKLPNLNYLYLGGNKLEGSIPSFVGNLSSLNYLYLRGNKLEGSIPSFVGNLSSLTSLDVSYNHLSGNFPESLGQLKLSYLNIGGNSWEGVLSEKNFANQSSLRSLDLSSTSFIFDFDPNWVPPFQLKNLDLSNTSLGPNFPAWLYTQRSLYSLDISTSGISTIGDTDKFWSFIARIDDEVDLSNNLMSGDISNVTLNSSSICLNYNNFTGGLPHISTNVFEFQASYNSFSGSISQLLCHPLSDGENILLSLDLSYNHLTGMLPDCWANWKQLHYLSLQSNKLTGKLPPSMASLDLLTLDLRDNNFYGKFSLNQSNWTNLQYLLLDGNEFSGSLPNPHMAQNLQIIKLRSNQFIGNIPSQLCNLSLLTVLDLAENKLSGSIPHCLYNITNPTGIVGYNEMITIFTKGRELDYRSYLFLELESGIIDLSANSLSGEIPKELFSNTQMYSLNLSRNHLSGEISKEIGGMKNLESLDLSYNRLSGEIPSTISNLSFLQYLNLSYNNFIGQIPLGTQIQSFDSWSFVGNRELCGDPLPKKCNKSEETRNSKLAKLNEDDNFLKSLYLGMGVGFAVGFWGVCGSLFLIRAWRHKFFRWFEHLVDQLYVAWALYFKSFS